MEWVNPGKGLHPGKFPSSLKWYLNGRLKEFLIKWWPNFWVCSGYLFGGVNNKPFGVKFGVGTLGLRAQLTFL